jgi:hypothetical protein
LTQRQGVESAIVIVKLADQAVIACINIEQIFWADARQRAKYFGNKRRTLYFCLNFMQRYFVAAWAFNPHDRRFILKPPPSCSI